MMIIRINKRKVLKYSLIFAVPALILWLAYYRAYMSGDDFNLAVMRGNTAKARLYLKLAPELAKYRTMHDYTALHWAAMEGNIPIAKLLLDNGADINAKTRFATPLILAAQKGRTKMVRFLLSHKAYIGDAGGYIAYNSGIEGQNCMAMGSLLHIAVAYGHTDTARTLIKMGVDPNARNRDDQTPLWLAVKAGDVAMVKTVLANGADANLKCGRVTALWQARSYPVAEQLLRHQTRPLQDELNYLLFNGIRLCDFKMIELALFRGANTNATAWMHKTPLHLAAQSVSSDKDTLRLAELLIQHGAKIDVLDENGM